MQPPPPPPKKKPQKNSFATKKTTPDNVTHFTLFVAALSNNLNETQIIY